MARDAPARIALLIDDADERAWALVVLTRRLPPKEALAIARAIDDAGGRTEALAEVAQRLPADEQPAGLGEQPVVLGEALSAARAIGEAWWRARALAKLAQRLPSKEAWRWQRSVGGGGRART